MFTVEEVVCDKCRIPVAIPMGHWFTKCDLCSHLVVRPVETGFKYVQKKCNGAKTLHRVRENATQFWCYRCSLPFKIEDTVARQKCGQNVYKCVVSSENETVEDVLSQVESRRLFKRQENLQQCVNDIEITPKDHEIAQLKAKLQQVEDEMTMKNNELAAKDFEIDALKADLVNCEDSITKKNEQIRYKNGELSELVGKLKQAREDAKAKLIDHSRELKESQEQNRYLDKQLKEFTVKCQKLRVENGINIRRSEKLRNQLQSTEDLKSEYTSEIERLKQEMEEMRMENKKISEVNTAALKKVNELTFPGYENIEKEEEEEGVEMKKKFRIMMI